MKSRWAYAVIASLSWGCSASTEGVTLPPDETGGEADSSVSMDSSRTDSGAGDDTSSGDDTASPTDSGMPSDTTVGDTGTTTDTATSDTLVADTFVADTETPDTFMPDTSTCGAPSKMCGGSCTNVTSDVNNCGDCGTTCPTSGVCAGGVCACPVSRSTLCGSAPGLCTDTRTDNNNCGACGTVCGTGKVCTMGVCGCAPGLVNCGTTCKDLSSDETACGSCTVACATGATCVSGGCACPTATPDICSGTCVDKKTDNAHCGACGNACAIGATCVTTGTLTACQCPTGQIVCGGRCVSPATDTANCGGCGLTCTGGTCAGGTCSCPSGKVKCGGACVDVSSDPRNCGGCGISCGTSSCISGVCPVPACKAITATKVLFYGPIGSAEQPLLPPGATVTVATETQWRGMTRGEFEAYDIIVIGQPSGGGTPTSTQLQAAYDTRTTWGAAVTGRVAVLGVDPGYHGPSVIGANTFGKATFAWLARGPMGKTALYVSSDWDVRNLDFLSPFGTFGATAGYGDAVTITDSAHPVFVGSTSTSMSNWGSSIHSLISTYPTATFRAVATGTLSSPSTTSGSVVVVHDDACTP